MFRFDLMQITYAEPVYSNGSTFVSSKDHRQYGRWWAAAIVDDVQGYRFCCPEDDLLTILMTAKILKIDPS